MSTKEPVDLESEAFLRSIASSGKRIDSQLDLSVTVLIDVQEFRNFQLSGYWL